MSLGVHLPANNTQRNVIKTSHSYFGVFWKQKQFQYFTSNLFLIFVFMFSIILQAIIVSNGKLTPSFEYIGELRKKNEQKEA